jgi:hypothetical protein
MDRERERESEGAGVGVGGGGLSFPFHKNYQALGGDLMTSACLTQHLRINH